MDPITLSLLMSGVQGGVGLWQQHQAKQFEKDRPEFVIPQAQQQALNSAKHQASLTGLPGQDLMEAKLGKSTANAILDLNRSADSPSAILGNISTLYGKQMDKENDLGIAAAENYQRNQGVLRDELHNMADWQQRAWDYNENQPYQAGAAAASALRGSGMQNIMTGVSNAAGVGSNYLMAKQLMQDFQGNNPWAQLAKTIMPQIIASNNASYTPGSDQPITSAPSLPLNAVNLTPSGGQKYDWMNDSLFSSLPMGGIVN